MKIDFDAIVARGYTLNKEYEEICKPPLLTKIVSKEPPVERFWIIKVPNNPNLFIFANDVLEFMGGPRPSCGMVGWHDNGVMNSDKTIDLFIKAGKEAIDYFHNTAKNEPEPK